MYAMLSQLVHGEVWYMVRWYMVRWYMVRWYMVRWYIHFKAPTLLRLNTPTYCTMYLIQYPSSFYVYVGCSIINSNF